MESESAGLLILLFSLLLYVRSLQELPIAIVSPLAQREIDPTRWRHNGTQPLSNKSGNQEPIYDQHVYDIQIAL